MSTKFKALYYLNGYVDTTKLHSGIYQSARPTLLSETETMDSVISAAEKIGYNADYIRNLKQCKLVEVNVEVKPEVKDDYEWVCNECNFPNFTSAVPENEIDNEYHACINCGGFEFHKRKKK